MQLQYSDWSQIALSLHPTCHYIECPDKVSHLYGAQGTDLMKHGRHGKPKVHYFRLAENDTHLTWRSAKGNQRGVVLTMVTKASNCCH